MTEGFVYGGAGLSSIDGKSRVTIPAELRVTVEASSAAAQVCLARHADLPCLVAFGRHERQQLKADLDFRWQKALENGQSFDREAEGARVAPFLMEVGFEANGRFVLPPMLMRFGGLSSRAFFFGNLYRIQIWDPERLLEQSDPMLSHAQEALVYCLEASGRRGR